MAVPKYFEMIKPLLKAVGDGKPHGSKELKQVVSREFSLTESDLAEMLPSGRQTVFANRLGWAGTYLVKAGLLERPARATFQITPAGKSVLKEDPPVIDPDYLERFESFRAFRKPSASVPDPVEPEQNEGTPDDTFEEAFKQINDNLADEVLSEVIKLSPVAFEQMVIDLLYKMGYGAFENSGRTTPVTNDEGIDGIIMEDKLGFDLIYIQAKKWDPEQTIGRPQIQNFVGAISGKGGKGLFVTTARYAKTAIEYAYHQHIILIDGPKLARLMIEHNFGVSVQKTFEIKAIDTDLFNNYAE